MRIAVQEAPFDFGGEAQAFAAGHNEMGAIVTFTGVVRDTGAERLEAMEIEHYPSMTEAALEKIALQATERWRLGDVLVIHRHGRLVPGDKSVWRL